MSVNIPPAIGAERQSFWRTHWQALVFCVVALLVFAITFAIGLQITLTPDCMLSKLALDEVRYTRAHISQRVITNLWDVLQNTYYLYFDWTGRFTTTLFLYLFGILPELVFAAANAAFFVLCAAALCLTAKACLRRPLHGGLTLCDAAMFAVCAMLLWMVPDPGQIITWKTGAIVYLHPLAYSLPFFALHICAFCKRGPTPKRPALFAVGMALYGFFAGATVEHFSLTLLFGCGALLAVQVFTGARKLWAALESWECASLLSMAAGVLIMLAAPGNTVRQGGAFFSPAAALSIFDARLVAAHFKRIYDTGYFFFLLVLLAALALVALLLGKRCRAALGWSTFFVLLANISLLALYFSPYLGDRTYCIAYYFYLLAVAVLAWFLLQAAPHPALRLAVTGVALCVTVLCVVTPFGQMAEYRASVRRNEAIVAEATARGENVMVVSVEEDTPFNPYARFLYDSFELGANRSYATLHGLDLIVSGTDTATFRFDADTADNQLPAPHTFAPNIVLEGVYTRQNAECLFVLLEFNETLDTQRLYQNRKQYNQIVLTAEVVTDTGTQAVQQIVYPGYRLRDGKNIVYTNILLPGKVQVTGLTMQMMNPETQQNFSDAAQIVF